MKKQFIKFWNNEKYLSITVNTCSGLAILLTILVVYMSNSLDGLEKGINYYNVNSLHYSLDEYLAEMLTANPQLRYSSDLPKDAYVAYLKMENHNLTLDQLNQKVQGVNTLEDYFALRTDNPLVATNKYGQEYYNKSIPLIKWITRITILAALLQVLATMLSIRRDSLQYKLYKQNNKTLITNMKTYKIVVFVPEKDADKLREAMGNAGAGKVGNYTFCSFSVKGVGRFKPEAGANPTIGEVGKFEEVAEERIETVCSEDNLEQVLQAIKSAHPYEEPATDVYLLQ